ncbi:MAG: hypothetical protein ABIA63_03705 [bacterium]
MEKNIMGSYGPWAANLAKEPGRLSFLNKRFKDINTWQRSAKKKVIELMAGPNFEKPEIRTEKRYDFDGLYIEELSWQLPYGPRSEAVFLKPADAKGKLPGILALHDHAAKKYFGKRKITSTGKKIHPLMQKHKKEYYGGRAWANELAKRGYAVLVPDAFLFESRRLRYSDIIHDLTRGRKHKNPENSKEIHDYNEWTRCHEQYMARSLFCTRTTWPGIFVAEDQCALDILCTHKDVDAKRIGCGGLSGGGLRTLYLAGIDKRIKSCFCTGFMTTWKDLVLNKSHFHSWMVYLGQAPIYFDLPEILGLRVPLPTMVLNCRQDPLFTLKGMKEADRILSQVFKKAGALDKYSCKFYNGGHKFDAAMQKEAFCWLDKWLK